MIIAGHFHQRIIAYPVGPGSKPGWLAHQLDLPDDGDSDEAPPREDWNGVPPKTRFWRHSAAGGFPGSTCRR